MNLTLYLYSTPHSAASAAKIKSSESCAYLSAISVEDDDSWTGDESIADESLTDTLEASDPASISVGVNNPSSSGFRAEIASSSTGIVVSISPPSRKRGLSGGGPLEKVKKSSTAPTRRSPRTKPTKPPTYKF